MKIAQLTDSHLQCSVNDFYKGILPDKHLQQCFEWVASNDIDMLLLTGDLCHDATPATYHRLLNYLKNALGDKNIPCHWLPGNHDDPAVMVQVGNEALAQDFDNIRVIENALWDVVLLNSTHQADGKGGGAISPWQLQQLDDFLANGQMAVAEHSESRPKLLVLHHNPVAVDSLWQDAIMLANNKEFCDLVTKFPSVKAVLCGHIHQPLDKHIQGIRFLGSPATSVQFACHQDTFIVNPALGPGLRTLRLQEDGCLETEVIYLPKP